MRNSSEGWISSEVANSQFLVFSLPGCQTPVIVTSVATNDKTMGDCGLTGGTIIHLSGIELQLGVQSERGFLIRQKWYQGAA